MQPPVRAASLTLLLFLFFSLTLAAPSSPPPPPSLPPPPPNDPNNTNCPAESMKMGLCVDLMWGMVHGRIGPEANEKCCPLFSGMIGINAAMCLCMTFTLRVMNLTLFMPVALQLLLYCGNNPPPGYTCPDPPTVYLAAL